MISLLLILGLFSLVILAEAVAGEYLFKPYLFQKQDKEADKKDV